MYSFNKGYNQGVDRSRRYAAEDLNALNAAEDRTRRLSAADLAALNAAEDRKLAMLEQAKLVKERDRLMNVAQASRDYASDSSIYSSSPFTGTNVAGGPITAGVNTGGPITVDVAEEAERLAAFKATSDKRDVTHAADQIELLKQQKELEGQYGTGITSIQGAVKGKSYEDYLPELRAGSNSFAQLRDDVQLANELNTAAYIIENKGVAPTGNITQAPDFITDTWGDIKKYFTDSDDPVEIAESDAEIATLREARDWYETGVLSDSPSELYFMNNPDKWAEAKAHEGGFLKYYTDKIKPLIDSNSLLTDSKKIHTKEQVAQAKADYASLITNTDNAIETLKQMTKDASQPMKDEFAKYEADIAAAEKARAAGNLKREQKLLEKVKKNPVHNMLNAEAYGQDVKQKITARERLVEQFNYASKTLKDMDKVNEIQTKIVQADIDLWSGVAYQGVANLKNGKGVAVIESVLGEYEGATIRVVSRSDGTYMVAGNGQFMEPGKGKGNVWTKGELEDYVLGKASATYKAKMMERSDMMFKAKVKGQVTAQDRYNKVAELNKIIAEVTLQNKGKMDIEAFKKLSGVTDVKPLGDGTATFTHGGNLFSYNPFPGTSEINGVEVPNKKVTEIYHGTSIYNDATGTK
jgi:hypothetical protein